MIVDSLKTQSNLPAATFFDQEDGNPTHEEEGKERKETIVVFLQASGLTVMSGSEANFDRRCCRCRCGDIMLHKWRCAMLVKRVVERMG